MKFGFTKVAAAVPAVKLADPQANADAIIGLIEKASQSGAEVIVFPELCITGYTCGDLFSLQTLLSEARKALARIVEQTRKCNAVCVVGMPLDVDNALYNTAVVFCRGTVYGIVPKTYIPSYEEFYETRWFTSSTQAKERSITVCGQEAAFGTDIIFEFGQAVIGVEICEDLWAPIPPSSFAALNGANLIVNLSASNELAGKHAYRLSLIDQQAARTVSAYLYCSAGYGESTTDLVFAGDAIISENGTRIAESRRFSLEEQITYAEVDLEKLTIIRRRKNTFCSAGQSTPARRITIPATQSDALPERRFELHPFIPKDDAMRDARCREIFDIQVAALCSRLRHTGARNAVVGISGGLDSTLALLVTVLSFDRLSLDRSGIIGITMPGFGTTSRTYENAVGMIRALCVSLREISIKKACEQHFADIGLPEGDRSVTYENAQARERTQILMDVANMTGGLVIGTGDLSELALGWATYNGDQMSMYGVNAGVPKTLVKHLVRWAALQPENSQAKPYLLDTVATPISPELLPADETGRINQCTESLVGPYELHDFFLYHFVRFGFSPSKLCFMAERAFEGIYDRDTIKHWLATFLRRFFTQQFKRSAMPDGPKVGSVSLSPRGDWRMPSDARSYAWIKEV